MNMITRLAPTTNEITPWRIESLPSEGPTVLSSRISAGAEHDRKIARFFDIEIAGDRSVAAADPLLDDRRGVNAIVEDDRQAAFDVGRGDLLEQPCARAV